MIIGTSEAPILCIVSRQYEIFLSISFWDSLISTTKRIRLEEIVSSRVEWNACIRVRGKRSINPTVSVNNIFFPERAITRVVVESVVNNSELTGTASFVSTFHHSIR